MSTLRLHYHFLYSIISNEKEDKSMSLKEKYFISQKCFKNDC